LLEVLDEVARPKVVEGAFDEIFASQTPILMGVEPSSLCWVLGEVAQNRDGQTWAREFQKFPALEHAITDAGSGLLKGLALDNASRSESKAIKHSLDVFHTLREGSRAWRKTESQVWKLNEQAQDAAKRVEKLKRQGKSSQGHGTVATKALKKAEQALDSAIEVETAWKHVQECLQLFTPAGELNTATAARAKLDEWLPGLKGPQWAKTIRLLKRPESLTFLPRIEDKLTELPLSEDLKQDALRFEGLRRRQKLLEGEDPTACARRGWWLIANVRHARDEDFKQAVLSVRGVLRNCWRASSLVEGINSVVRMQQARHRKLTPGLISLKRLFWNCRRFRTGHRRKHSPYELLGITIPASNWWDLLKLPPDRLKQELSTQSVAP
jgi:hypothetical protein